MPAPSQNSAHGCALRKRLTERERHTHTYTPSFSLSVSLSLYACIYISYILHIVSIKFHKYIFDVNVCSILTCLRIPHAPCRSGDRLSILAMQNVTEMISAHTDTLHSLNWMRMRRTLIFFLHFLQTSCLGRVLAKCGKVRGPVSFWICGSPKHQTLLARVGPIPCWPTTGYVFFDSVFLWCKEN